MKHFLRHALFCLFLALPASAQTYSLTIAEREVDNSGKPVTKITINGGIPGPTLHFKEGQDAVIHVTNQLAEDTSIHWHGLLLDGAMDGVPGLNGFKGIKPGETFTYRFPLRQSGTYWYHAHSLGQEQDGHYGALVIHPREPDPNPAERDYVVLLSDFSQERWDQILANLKKSAHYYNFNRRTVGDFFDDVTSRGFAEAWNFVRDWGEMRMSPTDLADVSGYTFLVNGMSPEKNWTAIFNRGERVRLRFINASAMSIYDVRIPGLKLKIIQADGQPIEPIEVDEFRFGVAETYDVLVEPDLQAYTIVAEPIDRSGFALATLAPKGGMKNATPEQRPRALLSMADMGMAHDAHSSAIDHSEHQMPGMDHEMPASQPGAPHDEHCAPSVENAFEKSGWAMRGTPAGHRALDYRDLRFLVTQQDTREPSREYEMVLGGNMDRYLWTLNGKRHQDSSPIRFSYGERVRIKFTNTTMMAHPMHLHGMFVQLENGQPTEKLPNKHTIIIPPGSSYSVILTANEPGEWAFHCHLLYHMLSGMMTTVVVSKPGETVSPSVIETDSHGSHDHQH